MSFNTRLGRRQTKRYVAEEMCGHVMRKRMLRNTEKHIASGFFLPLSALKCLPLTYQFNSAEHPSANETFLSFLVSSLCVPLQVKVEK